MSIHGCILITQVHSLHQGPVLVVCILRVWAKAWWRGSIIILFCRVVSPPKEMTSSIHSLHSRFLPTNQSSSDCLYSFAFSRLSCNQTHLCCYSVAKSRPNLWDPMDCRDPFLYRSFKLGFGEKREKKKKTEMKVFGDVIKCPSPLNLCFTIFILE